MTAVVLAAVASGAPAAASAAPLTAVVTMGDSYISGEGGRWLGNSPNLVLDRDGTDRACVFTFGVCASYDPSKVYGATAANGCHRSDVAEVHSAQLPVERRINIACSGAVTSDLLRASSGGTMPHGETPQGDQLLPVAQANRVRMIVVSIGGNDLGFASIVQACFTAYLTKTTPCSQSQAGALSDANLAAAATKVAEVIDEIRAVMRQAGYGDSGYRLVLQTYPTVLPRAADARYAELSAERTVYGCPFYDADLDWGHDVAAPRIGSMVKSAAAMRGVETVDALHAFDGHEFCAKTAAASTPLGQPPPSGAEWGRAVSASTIAQGEVQEVFHPDAYGQMALGNCLTRLYAAGRGNYTCTGAAGRSPQQMILTKSG
ncbi:MAG: GDSL-type esterase/lipase family protein [Solirubrobacteraceae bacterium]